MQVYIVILVIECLCIYYLFVETKGMLSGLKMKVRLEGSS